MAEIALGAGRLASRHGWAPVVPLASLTCTQSTFGPTCSLFGHRLIQFRALPCPGDHWRYLAGTFASLEALGQLYSDTFPLHDIAMVPNGALPPYQQRPRGVRSLLGQRLAGYRLLAKAGQPVNSIWGSP